MATKSKSTIIDMPDESDMIAEAMKEVRTLIIAGQMGSGQY